MRIVRERAGVGPSRVLTSREPGGMDIALSLTEAGAMGEEEGLLGHVEDAFSDGLEAVEDVGKGIGSFVEASVDGYEVGARHLAAAGDELVGDYAGRDVSWPAPSALNRLNMLINPAGRPAPHLARRSAMAWRNHDRHRPPTRRPQSNRSTLGGRRIRAASEPPSPHRTSTRTAVAFPTEVAPKRGATDEIEATLGSVRWRREARNEGDCCALGRDDEDGASSDAFVPSGLRFDCGVLQDRAQDGAGFEL